MRIPQFYSIRYPYTSISSILKVSMYPCVTRAPVPLSILSGAMTSPILPTSLCSLTLVSAYQRLWVNVDTVWTRFWSTPLSRRC